MATWSVSVSFIPPSTTGGAPITDYTVTSIPGGMTASGTTSPITMDGLTVGTAYQFTVHATNISGAGPETLPSNTMALIGDTLSLNQLSISNGYLVDNIYYTTTLYPVLIQDTLSMGLPLAIGTSFLTSPTFIDALSIGVPSIATGALTTVISYKSYLTDADIISIGVPSIATGELTTVISHKSYLTDADIISIGVPSIATGALTTVISYIAYSNWQQDKLLIGLPSIPYGSLT